MLPSLCAVAMETVCGMWILYLHCKVYSSPSGATMSRGGMLGLGWRLLLVCVFKSTLLLLTQKMRAVVFRWEV